MLYIILENHSMIIIFSFYYDKIINHVEVKHWLSQGINRSLQQIEIRYYIQNADWSISRLSELMFFTTT